MSSVSTQNLVVTHAGYPALAKCSFELPMRHFTLVTGENGSGKTTLLKAIAGIVNSQRGIIAVDGGNSTSTSQSPRRLRTQSVYVGHSALFMRHITVLEHLNLCMELDRTSGLKPDYVLSIEEVIDLFKLELRKKVRVEDLSAGQQRRLHLASAFIRMPAMLCIDEPHVSLDEKSKDTIDAIISDQFEAGRSFMIATHDPNRLDHLSTHQINLNNGVAKLYDAKNHGESK